VMATSFLLALGAQAALANTSSATTTASTTSSGAAASTSTSSAEVSVTSSSAAAATSSSAAAAPTTSHAATQPTTSAVAPSPTATPGKCPDTVTITFVSIDAALDSSGNVVVHIRHTGHSCPDAKPATLHIHENLLSTPQAGSDPAHQSNTDFSVGPQFGDSVSVPLLSAVEGECFVQVDAHAGDIHRGRFFPTATCSETSPSESSRPPTTPASSTVPATSTVPVTTPVSSSVEASSSSRSLPTSSSAVAAARTSQQLASTGPHTVGVAGLAALLLGSGSWLLQAARRPRRH
jgi:hypothetical protein